VPKPAAGSIQQGANLTPTPELPDQRRLVEPFSSQEFLYPTLDFIAYYSNIFDG
jgi:hypothetical protein